MGVETVRYYPCGDKWLLWTSKLRNFIGMFIHGTRDISFEDAMVVDKFITTLRPQWDQKGPKMDQIAQIRYLLNHLTWNVGWPLKMTTQHKFLLCFTSYTLYTTGSTIFWQKREKRTKKPKFNIYRTVCHRSLVDHSKWYFRWCKGYIRCETQ